MKANTADVVFDYQGALSLARQLWALADEVTHTAGTRRDLGDQARINFTGNYGDELVSRLSVEATNLTQVANGLRDDATAVAQMWKEAMDEENRRIYGRHVDDMKNHRSVLDSIGDFFAGFHYPPEPQPVPLPHPPAFAPTAECVRY